MSATEQKTEEYAINASGKALGRVASEIAKVLMGKHRPEYTPNAVGGVSVVVSGAKDMHITERRLSKEYVHYSGYPGGLKKETLSDVLEKKGHGEALRRAVYGMLPSNKLRSPRMKRLIIND